MRKMRKCGNAKNEGEFRRFRLLRFRFSDSPIFRISHSFVLQNDLYNLVGPLVDETVSLRRAIERQHMAYQVIKQKFGEVSHGQLAPSNN